MARESEGPKGETQISRRQNELPPELIDIIWPAIQVGGLAGISGFMVGGFAGIARSSPPALFALASGIQWFTLGTTFTASRGFVLHAWGKDKVTTRDQVSASAIAGAVSGAAGGLLRNRKNMIPGAIVFALFGATGQAIYNRLGAQPLNEPETIHREKKSWMNSKFMKVLTDREYEEMLREKLLKVEVEIALIDDRIEALRAQEEQMTLKKSSEESRDK